jgi:hypothetical protein
MEVAMPETSGATRTSSRRFFIGGSDARIIMEADEGTNDRDACPSQHWGEKGRKVERADLYNPPQNLNQHWYVSITGGMPLRWYIVAVCCGTIVILLGWYPWGILLVLLSLPRDELPTTRSNGSVIGRVSGRHGTPR